MSKKGEIKLVLLTTTNCNPCSETKKELKEHIDRGEIKVLNIQTSDEGANLAMKYKIYSVPKLLVIDSNGVPFAEIPIQNKEQTI